MHVNCLRAFLKEKKLSVCGAACDVTFGNMNHRDWSRNDLAHTSITNFKCKALVTPQVKRVMQSNVGWAGKFDTLYSKWNGCRDTTRGNGAVFRPVVRC